MSQPTVPQDEERSIGSHKEGDDKIEYELVDWELDDPANPRNWSTKFKSWLTFQLSMLALSASLGSSIISPAQNTVAEYIGLDEEVAVLSLSLYILGFAFGPLIWAPISEVFGRRWSLLPAMFCLGVFSIGTAVSTNAQSIFITRFFGGVFGSAPVSNVSAALGDIWHAEARGTAISIYAIVVVGGPTIGPLIGSAILVNPHLGWRWIEYILAIFVFAVFGLACCCLPEVYAPVLLHRKAIRMRKETGNQKLHHEHEDMKLDIKSIIAKQLSRPLIMLFTEPMVMSIALYASFVYSLLYLTLEVFPIVFEKDRGFSPVLASLPFLGLFIGVVTALGINLGNQPRYIRASRAAHGKPVPEARCPPIVAGGILFAIGLFWFGWTADPKFHWAIPTVATILIGAGFNTIFQQCINFLVDTYGIYAASAIAANTFLRSVLAAAFPLLAMPMFNNLGTSGAMSILGALATAAIPVPFLFMRFGKQLRTRSKFAAKPCEED